MLEVALSAHLSEDDDEPFLHEIALAEREDLRAALDWGAAHDPTLALELATELENLWSASAPDEGVRRLADLLRRSNPSPRLRARALRVLAGSAHQLREWELTDQSYDESLRLFAEVGDERGMALVETRLAYRAFPRYTFSKEEDLARRLVERSERRAAGRFILVEAQNAALLGRLALERGELDAAEAYAQRGRELAAPLEWRWWNASLLQLLADIALRRQDVDAASAYFAEALRLSAGDESVIAALHHIAGLARVAQRRGDLDRAGLLWGAICVEGERVPGWAERATTLGDELSTVDAPEFIAAVERGRELDVWDAVAIALGEDDPLISGETH